VTTQTVEIHYRRLPSRVEIFRQLVLHETTEYISTFLAAAVLRAPLVVGGRPILEPGSPVVWFTYPDAWFDVGRFHRADGTFTGYYANILTPVLMDGRRWTTTDLCLDVWMGVDGTVALLDEEDLAAAVANGWIDPTTAATARSTADSLLKRIVDGTWPPRHVKEWRPPRQLLERFSD